MSTAEFNAIVEDFDFIDDWEDRYRYIIEKGKSMPSLDDALKVEATKEFMARKHNQISA